MWKAQPTRLSETVANRAAGIQTPKKKMYISNAWVSESARKQKPSKRGQLLVIGVKWKEINLECLHGKRRVWVARFGCLIWGYEGINHTNTCAWNTCWVFVQNLPKMPICRIKFMECPPPSQFHPHKPLVRNLWKNRIFGEIWVCLGFVRFSWWDDSISLSVNQYWKIPSHFTSGILW